MSRIITVVASAFTLAGCSSMSPSLDFLPKSEPPPVTVQFQSEPAGAEAKISTGGSCQTPCALAVPPDSDFSVTFALAGYQPQTVPVKLSGSEAEKAFTPNPVSVELQPPPKAPARKPAPAKKPAAAASAQAPASKPAAAAASKPAPASKPAAAAPAVVDPWPPVR